MNSTGIYYSLYLNVKYISQIYYDSNQMSNLLAKFISHMVFLTSVNSNSILAAAQTKNLRVILADYSLTFISHSQSFRKSCWSSLKIISGSNNCSPPPSPSPSHNSYHPCSVLGYGNGLLTDLSPKWSPCFH